MQHLQGISTRKTIACVHKMDKAFVCVRLQKRKTKRVKNNCQMFGVPRSEIKRKLVLFSSL